MKKVNTIAKPFIQTNYLRWALTSVVFTALAVTTPLVAHHYNLAGQIFLPMHIFVLVAALLLGWRAGLIIGLLSPIISFAISGMPLLAVLPLVCVELAAYGLVAGWLRIKLSLPLWLSLISAMVAGRLLLLPATLVLSSSLSPVDYLGQIIKNGWPGIVLQLLLIPILVKYLKPLISRKNG